MSLIQLFVAALILVPAPVPKKEGWTGQIAMLKKSSVPYRNLSKDGTDQGGGSLLMIEYRIMQDKGDEVIVVENGNDVTVRKSELVLQSDAIVFFTEQIEKNPQDVASYAFRGWAWKQKKSLDNALKDYDKAVELDPRFAGAYANRGDVYAKKGEKERAISEYRQALAIEPGNDVALSGLKKLGARP